MTSNVVLVDYFMGQARVKRHRLFHGPGGHKPYAHTKDPWSGGYAKGRLKIIQRQQKRRQDRAQTSKEINQLNE